MKCIVQERSQSMSVLLKQYMQSLQLSASKRRRSGGAVESSSQTSCDYDRHHDRPCSAERRRMKRKRAAQSHGQPRRQSSTRRRACKGMQQSLTHKAHLDFCRFDSFQSLSTALKVLGLENREFFDAALELSGPYEDVGLLSVPLHSPSKSLLPYAFSPMQPACKEELKEVGGKAISVLS